VRGARVLEDRKAISAQQYIGTATTAEGLGAYIYNDLWYATYSAYVPSNGTVKKYTPAHYLRVAMTPNIKGWDVGFGGQLWKGTADSLETGKKSIAKQYGVFKLAVRPIRCHNGKPIGLPTWRDTKEMYLIDETWKKVFPLQEVTTGDFLCGEGKLSLHMVRVIHKKNLIELIKEGKLDFSLPKEFYKLKYLS